MVKGIRFDLRQFKAEDAGFRGVFSVWLGLEVYGRKSRRAHLDGAQKDLKVYGKLTLWLYCILLSRKARRAYTNTTGSQDVSTQQLRTDYKQTP